MENKSNTPQQNQFEEEKSNFDLMEWGLKILSYWYLFVIGAVIAFALSMLQNRKWIPQYLSSGTIIIKEYGPSYGGSSLLMQGFGVDAGYKNVNNQVIMLRGYDLMCRVVDSLPFMHVDYITQGRFKTRNIYNMTPVIVEPTHVSQFAYGMMFHLEIKDDGTLVITSKDNDIDFNIETRYGEPVHTDWFDCVILPTDNMVRSGKLYFRFRDRGSLVNDFSSRLGLDFVSEGSSVLQISLVSETPQRDCDFINMLCKCFLEDNLNRKNDVADNSIRFINQQLELLQKSLVVSEGAMTDFRQENKFVDVGSYAGTLMAKMESYDAQEMSLNLKETYLNYLENYIQTNMEEGGVAAPSSLGLNEPMLMTLVQQLNDLRIQRGELSEKNVYYAKYTKDIENVKEAINEVVRSMRASLEIEKKDLQTRYAQVQKDIKNLPEKELQMVAIERNYRIDDNYYTFFLQKRAEAEIQKASNMPDNDILDRARTTAVTNGTQKRKTTTRYLLIGLLIPLLLVILSELLNNKVRTPKEAERLSDFRLIGSVRHAKSENPTLVKKNPRSSYAEMLRSIRTRIEFIVQRKTGISIAITSTQSGDGKTFLSTNLAALYAMTGKQTLLIDLDIRKPNIHEKLGIENGLGVTNYLIGECSLEDVIHHHDAFDFDIMRAGTIPPNPGELIRSEHLTEMLDILKQRYEFIVIDSSPIGQVPDAYALVEQTDITLFVIRCMQTNKYFAKNTLQQLSVDHADKIQLILSDIPTERRGLRKSYGYAYGYGYGYGGYGYGYGYGGYGYGGYGYGSRYGRKKKDTYNYYSDDDE
ncbi:MAG: polysaccharide biosynthesis tyrosine autokinase [Paludibacteraceae bacterium]|nr:polysaccharide biosynthesis tyrosine autokinase [Paludibacteraceae bacterium]